MLLSLQCWSLFIFSSTAVVSAQLSDKRHQQPRTGGGGFLHRHKLEITGLAESYDTAERTSSKMWRTSSKASPTPAGISPLDLWGIHDLLLIGFKGPLITTGDSSVSLVQEGATALAGMLADIHPVEVCRTELAALGPQATLSQKADTSWSCLGLSTANFTGAFTETEQRFSDVANTEPYFDGVMGACHGSMWPRACSYWSSIHSMGLRADMQLKSNDYFQAILRIISGGALYCFGCTSHWRFLNANLLPVGLKDDTDLVAY